LNIAGTSSLHDWVSDATQLEWSGAFDVQDKKVVQVKDVRVTIPVKSIKSEKGGTMDDKTYEAFKSDKNPNITYAFQSAKISGSGPDFTLETIGALQMAGTTKNIDMTVKAKVLANGDIQLTGSKKINMTEFGMKPPTAVLGTIKVGPEVTINFDLTVTPTKQLP
jgi:polyisoprenoid-binding protein YceI